MRSLGELYGMSGVRPRVLIVDMEYSRSDFSEPIVIDLLRNTVESFYSDCVDVEVVCRSLGGFDTGRMRASIAKCDCVLVSTKVTCFDAFESIARECEAMGKVMIAGGPLATFATEQMAERFPECIFSVGECEQSLPELLLRLPSEPNVARFKQRLVSDCVGNVGFWYNGCVCEGRSSVAELADGGIAMPHSFLETTLSVSGMARLESSRGCPWNKCSFCVMPRKYCGVTWRPYPIGRITDEIVDMALRGARRIVFTDEDFIASSERACELSGAIAGLKRRGRVPVDLQYGGSTSVRTLISMGTSLEDNLISLQASGCRLLFIGVESGSLSQLRRFRKGVGPKDNMRIIQLVTQMGFELDVGFIMFDPEVTIDELSDNLDFVRECGFDRMTSRLCKEMRVVPNTVLCQNLMAKGLCGDFDFEEMMFSSRYENTAIHTMVAFLGQVAGDLNNDFLRVQSELRNAIYEHEGGQMRALLSAVNVAELSYVQDCLERFAGHHALSERDCKEAAERARAQLSSSIGR